MEYALHLDVAFPDEHISRQAPVLENNAQDTSSNESVYQRILNGTKNQFMRVKNIFSSNATQGASGHILSEIEEAQVPPYPGVYELKLRSAKRSGFIGSCLNLQFQIRQLKRQQSSGNILLEQMFSNSTAQIEMCYETGERVILQLCSTIRNPDVTLAFDRFFTSVNLIDNIDFPAVGTCISTRRNMPKFRSGAKLAKGESEFL
ncbi:unnamed protein product [Larinioides sclopetarius]|uniref:PiggyBac transposable element-derived protein domain-containing protein n=1 Tax=Larinioides sclopetarius TaxID=280406 RepID=A0AAV2A876_9ARAC